MFTWIRNRGNLGLITQILLQNGMRVNQDPTCHTKGSSLPSPLCNGCPNWTQLSMRQRRHFSTDWYREHVKWWLGKLEEATCFEEVAWNTVAVSNSFSQRSICCQQKFPPDSEAVTDVWGAWRSYCKKRKGEEGERKDRTNEKYSKTLWQILWAKAVQTKSNLLEQAGVVEEDSNNSPAKNHKSFPVKYPLLRVFHLLILHMLLSRGELVAFRGNRRQERLQDTAHKYGCAWNLKRAPNVI